MVENEVAGEGEVVNALVRIGNHGECMVKVGDFVWLVECGTGTIYCCKALQCEVYI